MVPEQTGGLVYGPRADRRPSLRSQQGKTLTSTQEFNVHFKTYYNMISIAFYGGTHKLLKLPFKKNSISDTKYAHVSVG